MVEQGTHKPLVGGSNPPSATKTLNAGRPSGSPAGRSDSGDTPFDSFTSGADTIRRGPAPVSITEAQDLRHGGVPALDAILGWIGGARSSPARPGGSS